MSHFLFANTTQGLGTHFVTSVFAEQNAIELERDPNVVDRSHPNIPARAVPTACSNAIRPVSSLALGTSSFYRWWTPQTTQMLASPIARHS